MLSRHPGPRIAALCLCVAAFAPPVHATDIEGRLELVAGPRQTVAPEDLADGLVYFLPKGGAPAPRPPGRFTMSTQTKGFSPALLVVPVGSSIDFPNRDDILHNVFSRTPGTTFDFGFYGSGQTRRQVFAKPGLVVVNCSVHHTMRANVVVMATPYYTRPARDGRFVLEDVPAGPGTLVYWHPRASAASAQVVLPLTRAPLQRLTVTKPGLGHDAGVSR